MKGERARKEAEKTQGDKVKGKGNTNIANFIGPDSIQ